MMCNPVVRAVTEESGAITLDLALPADLPCFRGHFPDFPILPGVVQIDWVMQLAVAHQLCTQPAASDLRIKFKQVIAPGAPLALTLRRDSARRRLNFVYRSGDLVASEGHVVLTAP